MSTTTIPSLRRRANRRTQVNLFAAQDEDNFVLPPSPFNPYFKRADPLSIVEVTQLAPASPTATYTYLVADQSTYQLVDPTATATPSAIYNPKGVSNPKATAASSGGAGGGGGVFQTGTGNTAVVILSTPLISPTSIIESSTTIDTPLSTLTITESTTIIVTPTSISSASPPASETSSSSASPLPSTSPSAVISSSASPIAPSSSSASSEFVFGGTSGDGQTAVVIIPTTSITTEVVTSTSSVPSEIVTATSVPTTRDSTTPAAVPTTTTSTTAESVFSLGGGDTAVVITTSSSTTPLLPAITESSTTAPFSSTPPITGIFSNDVPLQTALVLSSSASSLQAALSSFLSVSSAASSSLAVASSIASVSSSIAASSSSSMALATSSAAGDAITPPISRSHLDTSSTSAGGVGSESGSGSGTKTGTSAKPTSTSTGSDGKTGTNSGGVSGDSTSGFFSSVSRSASIGLTTLVCVAIALLLIGLAVLVFRCCSPQRRRERRNKKKGVVILEGDMSQRTTSRGVFSSERTRSRSFGSQEAGSEDPFRDPELGGGGRGTRGGFNREYYEEEEEGMGEEETETIGEASISTEEDEAVLSRHQRRREVPLTTTTQDPFIDPAVTPFPFEHPSPRTRMASSDWTSIVGDRMWPDTEDDRSVHARNRIPSLSVHAGPPPFATARKLSLGHRLRTAYMPDYSPPDSEWTDDDEGDRRTASEDFSDAGASGQQRRLISSSELPLPMATRPAPLPPTSPIRSAFSEQLVSSPLTPPKESWRFSLDRVMGAAAEVLDLHRRGSGVGSHLTGREGAVSSDKFTQFANKSRGSVKETLASRRGNTRPSSIVVTPRRADEPKLDLDTPVSSTYSDMFFFKPA